MTFGSLVYKITFFIHFSTWHMIDLYRSLLWFSSLICFSVLLTSSHIPEMIFLVAVFINCVSLFSLAEILIHETNILLYISFFSLCFTLHYVFRIKHVLNACFYLTFNIPWWVATTFLSPSFLVMDTQVATNTLWLQNYNEQSHIFPLMELHDNFFQINHRFKKILGHWVFSLRHLS